MKTYRSGKDLDFEIVQTNLLSYQTKQAFDLVICIMVLTFLPDSQIADAIEKLQLMTRVGGRNVISVNTVHNDLEPRPHLFENDELGNSSRAGNLSSAR
jgi:phospholipid N-methyltransferase